MAMRDVIMLYFLSKETSIIMLDVGFVGLGWRDIAFCSV